MELNVSAMGYAEVNEQMRQTADSEITLTGCIGQRFLAAGTSGKHVRISGIPGNALGAYLNGTVIETSGNAQDAVGDTMNEGEIIVHGNIGDAAGYAMRGGQIFVKGNAGYRAGIHMKDPIDGSLPGPAIPGILQAGTLEWVAISFSNA